MQNVRFDTRPVEKKIPNSFTPGVRAVQQESLKMQVHRLLQLLCASLVFSYGQAIDPAFAKQIVVYHVNQATYGAAPVNMVK